MLNEGIIKMTCKGAMVSSGNVFGCIIIFMVYMYVLCLLMALSVDNCLREKLSASTISSKIQNTYSISLNGLLNYCFILVLTNVFRHNNININTFIYLLIRVKNSIISLSMKSMYWILIFSSKKQLWVSALNLILIVICNPPIMNPGPARHFNTNKISVFYQNIRGFIPPIELGNPNPPLSSIKIAELQSYIYIIKSQT